MKISGLVRVGIIAALVTTFVSGLVAYYVPEAKGEVSIAGRTAPTWLLWTGGMSVAGVAYFSAVFWLLLRWKRDEDGSPRRLDFSDGMRALFGAPFVVAFFPLIILGGAVAGLANNSGEIRERMRAIYSRYGRYRRNFGSSLAGMHSLDERQRACPECGEQATNLPAAGAVNCKKCGMVSV